MNKCVVQICIFKTLFWLICNDRKHYMNGSNIFCVSCHLATVSDLWKTWISRLFNIKFIVKKKILIQVHNILCYYLSTSRGIINTKIWVSLQCATNFSTMAKFFVMYGIVRISVRYISIRYVCCLIYRFWLACWCCYNILYCAAVYLFLIISLGDQDLLDQIQLIFADFLEMVEKWM